MTSERWDMAGCEGVMMRMTDSTSDDVIVKTRSLTRTGSTENKERLTDSWFWNGRGFGKPQDCIYSKY